MIDYLDQQVFPRLSILSRKAAESENEKWRMADDVPFTGYVGTGITISVNGYQSNQSLE